MRSTTPVRRLVALATLVSAGLAAPRTDEGAAEGTATMTPMVIVDPQQSANWAGYTIAATDATSGMQLSFRAVSGEWTQPRPHCLRQSAFSAFWVGLGGASADSKALEQVGTSSDCNAAGKAVSSAWYEIVPAPARRARLSVEPGDRMRAVVAVDGPKVTLRIQNLTRKSTFTKHLTARTTDVSSAEWIAEAPSMCDAEGGCVVLPLADFGSVSFSHAQAITTDSRAGTAGATQWSTTPVRLVSQDPFMGVVAVPGSLTPDGGGFAITVQPA